MKDTKADTPYTPSMPGNNLDWPSLFREMVVEHRFRLMPISLRCLSGNTSVATMINTMEVRNYFVYIRCGRGSSDLQCKFKKNNTSEKNNSCIGIFTYSPIILHQRLLPHDLGVHLHRAIICSICLFAFMLLFSLSAQITAWLTLTTILVKRCLHRCPSSSSIFCVLLLLRCYNHVYGWRHVRRDNCMLTTSIFESTDVHIVKILKGEK